VGQKQQNYRRYQVVFIDFSGGDIIQYFKMNFPIVKIPAKHQHQHKNYANKGKCFVPFFVLSGRQMRANQLGRIVANYGKGGYNHSEPVYNISPNKKWTGEQQNRQIHIYA
jgi:hypothetical protein